MFLVINSITLSQYIGIGCILEYWQLQIFSMDANGYLNLENRINTNGAPYIVKITNNGIVIIMNFNYYPPTAYTLSIFKINEIGLIQYIKDIDLGGVALNICITSDNKYLLVYHQIESIDDYGLSVLEIDDYDIKTPAKQFLSFKNLGISASKMAVNHQGVLLTTYKTPLNIFNVSTEGIITYISSNIELSKISSSGEMEFDYNGSRCYITTENGLSIIEVDEYKNVYLYGYVETYPELSNPGEIVITNSSKTILESFNIQGNAVAIFRKQIDGSIKYEDKIEMERPGAMAKTPDGKYVVVVYNYTSTYTNITVLMINPDESIIRLTEKDIISPPSISELAFYKLPETSVKTNWQMYE